MATIRSVVQEARREERYGNLPGAIALYRKALARQENDGEPEDPNLCNLLADLYLRMGEPRTAVDFYERSLRQLEEQQLHGSAIALCKKILRNAPGHTQAYLWAGRLQTRVGLLAEARESYIEYANRMERAGQPDRGLEALREYVDLSGDEEIRLALADRYLVGDRTEDAVEELRRVCRARMERGTDATDIRRRIAEIDPDADPHAGPAYDEGLISDGGAMSDEGTPKSDAAADEEAREEELPGLDVAALASELQAVLNRLEGEEKLRQALPVIDQLLRLEPGQLGLLQRKLAYALALDDERVAAEAYLELGEALEAKLSRFKLRRLSTSSTDGVTTAVGVVGLPATAPLD